MLSTILYSYGPVEPDIFEGLAVPEPYGLYFFAGFAGFAGFCGSEFIAGFAGLDILSPTAIPAAEPATP